MKVGPIQTRLSIFRIVRDACTATNLFFILTEIKTRNQLTILIETTYF